MGKGEWKRKGGEKILSYFWLFWNKKKEQVKKGLEEKITEIKSELEELQEYLNFWDFFLRKNSNVFDWIDQRKLLAKQTEIKELQEKNDS